MVCRCWSGSPWKCRRKGIVYRGVDVVEDVVGVIAVAVVYRVTE